MKYAARAALGAVVMYAVLGHGAMTAGRDIRARSASHVGPNPTYWSTISTPEATPSPNHVGDANKAAAPIPDEVVVPLQEAPEAPVTLSNNEYDVGEVKTDDDVDVEAFLKRLLEEEEISQESIPDHLPPPPAPKVLTEEEKAEQRRQQEIKTKLKRDDITGRHTKWEKRLQEAAQEEEEELLEKVRKMRMEVVEAMRTKPEMFQLLKKMQVDGLKDTENLERYLKKMQSDGEATEDTANIWMQIVDRVSRKLDDKTIETTTYLQNWHAEIIQKEKAVVSACIVLVDVFPHDSLQFEASVTMLDEIANEAQADLGMDYAWLDDVSVHDWTRYHKLKDGESYAVAQGWGKFSFFNRCKEVGGRLPNYIQLDTSGHA
jgi:hypothetical protein